MIELLYDSLITYLWQNANLLAIRENRIDFISVGLRIDVRYIFALR